MVSAGLRRALVGALIGLMGLSSALAAKPEILGSYRDWDAARARTDQGLICYMVSEPKDWQASRPNVRRGSIYITITHKPSADVRDEVNVIAGYPFAEGSDVKAVVDGKTEFSLFTKGDGAWNYDRQRDRAMVAAMKKGLTLVVTGRSSRGTVTTDSYSLRGFTAAYNAISDACRV